MGNTGRAARPQSLRTIMCKPSQAGQHRPRSKAAISTHYNVQTQPSWATQAAQQGRILAGSFSSRADKAQLGVSIISGRMRYPAPAKLPSASVPLSNKSGCPEGGSPRDPPWKGGLRGIENYMFEIISSAKAEHLTSVAPSIRRAKS
jgi:hypothetical protein